MPCRWILTEYRSRSPALRPSGYTTAGDLPSSTTATSNKGVLMKVLLSLGCRVIKDAKRAIEIRDIHERA